MIAALVALLVAAPSAGPLPGPEGWRGARFGMTPDEVLAALPGEATRISPAVTLADGNSIEVGVDGTDFEGLLVDVRFVFTAGRLALVSLRTPQRKPVDADAYVRVRDALSRRWGAPVEDARDDTFIDLRQARWNRGAIRTDLKYIPGVLAVVVYPAPAGPEPRPASRPPQ